VRVPGRGTPTKSRILGGGVHTRRQQIVRVDRGPIPGELPGRVVRSLQSSLRAATADADGLLVADYGYGAATPDAVRRALQRRPELTVVVDSRTRVAQYRDVSACTPNQEELERALELPPLRDESALEKAGRRLLNRCRAGALLVTRGARGLSLFERRRRPRHVPAFGSDEVADVTGAGDTVTAVFTLALVVGATPPEAARLANYAAGLVVMKAGTATVGREELTEAVREARA
jgi:rfaE bifunctional protein kinase chain/domain